ncbi:hypothetical protein NMG60_11033856 [Bertholletia excelsa]
MSVIDILFRVESICRKYEKYDVEKQRELNASTDDAFSRLYSAVDSQIETALRKSEATAMETNRAKVVAMNAEIRRTKARLLEEVPKLQKLALKKVKGLSQEDLSMRNDMVLGLKEQIQSIPDGTESAVRQTGGWAASASYKNIKFGSDGYLGDDYFQQSEESNQFREEYEMRKMKQDQGLEVISEGLDTLKNLALDMNEELDRQVPLMDEMETKVDKATADLKNTNVKMKRTLTQIRSSRNFCIDIILLCVILGIASYLYNILK